MSISFKKFIQTLVVATGLITVPMFYNSCSSDHTGVDSASNASLKACSLDDYFERTWHPFLQRQCVTCHATGGAGKGAFADANAGVAYTAFSLAGFSKVASFAVNPAHNSPYTGDANKPEVDDLLGKWAAAEVEAQRLCGTDLTGDGTIEEDFSVWIRSRSRGIGANSTGNERTLTWDLDSDLIADANYPTGVTLSSVQFSVTVEVRENLGEVYYAIYDPVLDMRGASADLRLQGVAFMLNGKVIDNQTTFFYIDESKRRSDTSTVPLSSGAMIVRGTARISDVLSVSFKTLENVDLGPPPQGIRVFFAESDATVTEGGTKQFTLSLSERVPQNDIVVGIDFTANGNARDLNTGTVVQNSDGDDVNIRNFDWDFRLINTSVIFLAGETVKTLRVAIQDDERYEPTGENFSLRLGNIIGGAQPDSSARTMNITITDDDSPPDPNVQTYSQLMSPGGIFYQECVKCHNSVDNKGGYDITDYQRLLETRVLVPGDVSSKMFVRMNSQSANVDPMPLSGLLNSLTRYEVEKWILNGAKND